MGNWISENNSTFHTVQVPGLNNDFHTYKFIWKEGKITFYVDGVEKATHTTNVPSAPAHFMINHWGTNNPNGFGGEATIGEDQARYFHVDWVEFTPPPAPPPAPSNLTASVKSSGRGNNKIVEKVLLDWQDNSTNEDSFIIERCQVFGKGKNKSCNFVQLDFVGGNSITYSDATVTGRKTYRYRVKAHNDIGDSPFSNVAQAKTP